MTHLLLAALISVISTSPAPAQDAKPNFAGTWSLDVAKSDFGPMPAPESIVHVIEHNEPNIKITTTQKNVVAADGKTRTVTTVGTNAQGQQVNNVAVYERK